MGWHKLGSKTLNTVGDNIEVNIDSQESFQILYYKNNSGNANARGNINNDKGSNYANRYSQNDGADVTLINRTELDTNFVNDEEFFVFYGTYNDDEETLMISFNVHQVASGEATAPERVEMVHKYTKTNPVTKINFENTDTGDIGVNSNLSVIGTTDDLDKVTQ